MTGRRKILITDDNESIHQDFRNVLATDSSEVNADIDSIGSDLFGEESSAPEDAVKVEIDFAFQGQEAIQKVKAAIDAGDPYQLVFMDVRMPPGMDGLQAASEISQLSRRPEIVVCTAYSDYDFDEMSEVIGEFENIILLRKPFDSIEIRQIAASLTKKYEVQAALSRHQEELEQTIVEIRQELEHQKQIQLEAEKFVAIGKLAGGLAHEINNPLAIITGNAEIIKQRFASAADEPRLQKSVARIVENAKRISTVTQGLLETSGSTVEESLHLDLNEVIQSAVSDAYSVVDAAGNDIDIDISSEVDRETIENGEQLRKVFVNLITNAIRAAENGDEKWIKVEIGKYDSKVQIRIADSGPPLNQEVVTHLFTPFFTTKEVGDGTGLGLCISKGLIEMIGGTLRYDDSAENTTFIMELPAAS